MLQDNVYNIYVCIYHSNQFHFHMIAPPILPWITKKTFFFFKRRFSWFFLPNQPNPTRPTRKIGLQEAINWLSISEANEWCFRSYRNRDPVGVWLGFGGFEICPKKKNHKNTHLFCGCFFETRIVNFMGFFCCQSKVVHIQWFISIYIYIQGFICISWWLSHPLVRLDHFGVEIKNTLKPPPSYAKRMDGLEACVLAFY